MMGPRSSPANSITDAMFDDDATDITPKLTMKLRSKKEEETKEDQGLVILEITGITAKTCMATLTKPAMECIFDVHDAKKALQLLLPKVHAAYGTSNLHEFLTKETTTHYWCEIGNEVFRADPVHGIKKVHVVEYPPPRNDHVGVGVGILIHILTDRFTEMRDDLSQ